MRLQIKVFQQFKKWILTKENLWAFLLCMILILLIILTADSSPLWIYQGF